jgi:hypothetical protein
MADSDVTFTVEFTDDGRVRYQDSREQQTDPIKLVDEGLDFDAMLALSWYLETAGENRVDQGLLKILGQFLFEFLFPAADPVARNRRERFITLCDTGKVRVNLQFRYKARRFAQLPWEFLLVPGPRAAKFIAEFAEVSVTLFRFISTQDKLDRKDGGLSVLVEVNSPNELDKISSPLLEKVLEELGRDSGGRLQVRIARDRTLEQIKEDISETLPDIFHWSGHGSTRNALWLARQPQGTDLNHLRAARVPLGFGALTDTTAVETSISGISRLFDQHQPRLVILDGCHTDWSWQSELLPGVAHQLVEQVPAVIAMRYAISNEAAQTFSARLYQEIIGGKPLDDAVQAARCELRETGVDQGSRAFGTPVLYLKESQAICGPLIERAAPSGNAAPAAAARPQSCPLCGGKGLWTGIRCSACTVYFRCPFQDCQREYSWYNINGGLRACNWCGKLFDQTPWLDRFASGGDLARTAPPADILTTDITSTDTMTTDILARQSAQAR